MSLQITGITLKLKTTIHPSNMKLREYQEKISNDAILKLRQHGIVYLAMQTRTGKTLTALTVAEKSNVNNVLFVTKKKAIDSIIGDYNNGNFSFGLTVINFESVHKIEGNFDLIIVDEAHSIGQFPKPNNRCKKLKLLCKGKQIVYLSATPSPESYSQLYHQFWISDFSPLKAYVNFYKFAYAFVNIKKKYMYNREINDYSDCNKLKLWSAIKHIFITYTQEQAGFEVSVTEKILTVQMPNNLHYIIEKINKENICTEEGFEIVADTAVKVMQKTHQLSSGTVIDENGYQIVSTFKADFVKEYFKGKRLAIFYKFKSEFEMLKEAFPNYTDIAKDFQDKKNDTFLGQFVSAREGIRLDSADAIIFFNIDFSYLSYEQARNRIASFERKDKAILYWIFSDKGIESKIYKRVKNKEDYTLAHYRYDRKQI